MIPQRSVNDEKWRFLTLRSIPARVSVREAAWLLGFNDNDITVLIGSGLLKPLGRPRPSGSKFFASSEIARLREDAHWLSKASDAIVKYWRQKNAGRNGATSRSRIAMHSNGVNRDVHDHVGCQTAAVDARLD